MTCQATVRAKNETPELSDLKAPACGPVAGFHRPGSHRTQIFERVKQIKLQYKWYHYILYNWTRWILIIKPELDQIQIKFQQSKYI